MKPKRVPAPSTPGILDDDPTPMRRMTAEERLRFVVRFEQMDLDTLRPGDWLNLLDDFLAFFLAVSSPHRVMPHVWLEGVPSGNPSDELWSRQDFRALQQDVRTLLRSFAGAPDAQGAFVALHGEVAYAGGMIFFCGRWITSSLASSLFLRIFGPVRNVEPSFTG
jgi:hypothetical protein